VHNNVGEKITEPEAQVSIGQLAATRSDRAMINCQRQPYH